MPMHDEPVVGAVYKDLEEDGRTFEVIAFDENDGTIKIQYSDGSTGEIDLDDWYGMDLERLKSDDDEDDPDEGKSAEDDDTDLDDDVELDDEEEE
ncbi:MAG: hypothetical protein NUV51_02180 [Sulfuricaulis sp.]|nr:hypothetical protein [Sulfuricaulis sp.]